MIDGGNGPVGIARVGGLRGGAAEQVRVIGERSLRGGGWGSARRRCAGRKSSSPGARGR